jgi:hypothetical protein
MKKETARKKLSRVSVTNDFDEIYSAAAGAAAAYFVFGAGVRALRVHVITPSLP